MNKTCYIVGAGKNYGLDFTPQNGDYIIAADGGLKYLQEAGIKSDLIIGDFDSITETPLNATVIKLNVDKDDTDTLAAVRKGIQLGFDTFKIYCGTGGITEKSDGVTISGLKFELKNAVLYNHFPIGVSNEFIGKESFISVKSGTLILVYSNNIKEQII